MFQLKFNLWVGLKLFKSTSSTLKKLFYKKEGFTPWLQPGEQRQPIKNPASAVNKFNAKAGKESRDTNTPGLSAGEKEKRLLAD